MKNLIEEIEKLKPQIITDKYSDGFQNAIKMVLNKLNQYNIINAPKEIKLSEILDRLNISKWQDFQATKQGNAISIDNNNCFREYLNIENNKITDISDDMQVNEYKWLYTLWIAGTIIEDNFECDE